MNNLTQPPQASLFKSKQHFEVLDGMRGIAAISVVTFHFMEVAYTDYSKNFIGHGFLAVDFFFCLSGFVIAYAYDSRIASIGMLNFFKARLIRLHPLVILGSILGLLALLFDPFGGNAGLYSTGRMALIFLCSVFLIPFPVMKDRAFNNFGLNAPAWSLFWEYVANIIYALVLSRINRRWLVPILVASAAWLCFVVYKSGSLMGGWSGDNFWDGCARVCYSFTAGMLVYRYNLIIKNKLGFLGLGVLMVLGFVMPFSAYNWLTESLVVIIYFPLLVALGAGSPVSAGLQKLCKFSGDISYPLYMTHYAAIWAFANYYAAYKPSTGTLAMVIAAGVLLLLCFAWVVMVFYDIPLRKYLTGKQQSANVGK
ncbi:acyltransferase [Mucilaginibacter terrenus]|uniref:Acyltransferase n=1 Tax=Mucilaginibacter terrenus TaxID=2482727 RepID=A0A3E2NPM1_9SPHI|nr:acyltransferase [Mucilaginibacter terrenus]RFZ82901.1 acyltransferase [Mucilaginibacter terrenus]